jgi:membrane associated rhomboid family serine protease
VAEHPEELKDQHFIRALVTRSNPLTYLFLGINLGLFLLMWMAGGMGVAWTDPQVLLGFGAKSNELIDNQGQYWRFVTSIFLHIGFLHVLLNNYALWIIGQEIERLYGSSRFGLLYLTSGIAGSVASYFYNPEAVSAGASGAIFGLFGVMAAFGFRYRKEIPSVIRRDILTRVVPLIIINLGFGFSIKMIDNSAHVGGLVTGMALALIIPYQRPHERVSPAVWRSALFVCLAIIFGSFLQAFRNYDGPRPQLANLTRSPGSQVVDYWNSMRDGLNAFDQADDAMIEAFKNQDGSANLKAAIESSERAIASLRNAPTLDDEADLYRQRLVELLDDQKGLLESFSRARQGDRGELAARRKELISGANRFVEDYQNWLPGFLKKYGYEITQEQ